MEFRGCLPAARTFARLRIADPVAGDVARLATERLGSTLLGRVSHPLENRQDFASFSRSTFLPDQHVLVALRIPWVEGHMRTITFPQAAGTFSKIWTPSHILKQLSAHHTQLGTDLAGGLWIEHFSGKEIFRHLRSSAGVSWRLPFANDNDLARKIAETWRASNALPQFIGDLRDYIIGDVGL